MTRLLVLFALIIAVIWLAARRAADLAKRLGLRRETPADNTDPRRRNETAPVESMVECPVCGVWQPGRRRKACSRPDCPY